MLLLKARIIMLSTLFALGACCSPSVQETGETDSASTRNALRSYLENEDNSFTWETGESRMLQDIAVHELALTSQQWRGTLWKHQLTVIIPKDVRYSDSLLFITGGKLVGGIPEQAGPDDELLQALVETARANRAVVSILRQTPNQPLYDDLYEDALISYTLHNYRESKDPTWPLLFPMTKSALRAMDAVQEFCREETRLNIEGFVVSGASKRGWTTWLAGASDSRVKAICPMVIDVLNMPVQMDYQVTAWGDYSEAIQDYVDLGIAQDAGTPEGLELTEMIDPYSYREALVMPKIIFLGTNDQYWPVDAVKHYFDQLPGKNYLHYVPNAPHDLNGGEQALQTLSSFFGLILLEKELPECRWSVSQLENKAEIAVDTDDDGSLIRARLWTAGSADRDFRDETWIHTDLGGAGEEAVRAGISLPVDGFRAFYIDMFYPSPHGGEYSISTRVFVMDHNQIF